MAQACLGISGRTIEESTAIWSCLNRQEMNTSSDIPTRAAAKCALTLLAHCVALGRDGLSRSGPLMVYLRKILSLDVFIFWSLDTFSRPHMRDERTFNVAAKQRRIR
jgi:hypothetical protein